VPGGDQLEHGGKAGGAEAPEAPRIDDPADRERLIAQTMAVLKEQQLLRGDRFGEGRRRCGVRRSRGGREKEAVLKGRRLGEIIDAKGPAASSDVSVTVTVSRTTGNNPG
jgi:hypothetical protein